MAKYASVKESWKIVIYYFVFSTLIAIPFVILKIIFPEYISMGLLMVFCTILGNIAVLLFLFNRDKKKGLENVKLSFKYDFPKSLWGIIIASTCCLIFLEDILTFLPIPDYFMSMIAPLLKEPFALFLLICVGAPIFEEIIFRGIILKKMLVDMPPKKAIIQSSIIFACVHINPTQLFAAFFIGLVLGWLFIKTKSLVPSMCLHFVNNFLAFLSIYYLPKEATSFYYLIDSTLIYIILYLLSVGVFYICYQYLNKLFPEKIQDNQAIKSEILTENLKIQN